MDTNMAAIKQCVTILNLNCDMNTTWNTCCVHYCNSFSILVSLTISYHNWKYIANAILDIINMVYILSYNTRKYNIISDFPTFTLQYPDLALLVMPSWQTCGPTAQLPESTGKITATSPAKSLPQPLNGINPHYIIFISTLDTCVTFCVTTAPCSSGAALALKGSTFEFHHLCC